MKQQQEANEIAESETVQELKDALHFATQELKTAKEENASLKEKIAVLEDAHKMEVSSLREELELKDEALQRRVKKRRARTIELLHESTIKDMETNTREQHWSSRWQSTEKSLKEEEMENLQENLDEWKSVLQELAPDADHQEETLETNSQEEKLENHEGEEEGTDKKKQETKEDIEENLEGKSDEKTEDKRATEDPNLCLVPIPLTPSDSCPLTPVPTAQLNPSTSSLPYPPSRALSYSSPSSYSLRNTLSLHTFPRSSPQPYSLSRAPSYYLPWFPVQPINSNEMLDLLFCSF